MTTMEQELETPARFGRVDAHTSRHIAGLSDDERNDIARALAGGDATPAPDAVPDPDAAALRLQLELHRAERRIDRLERLFSFSRYGTGSGGPPPGPYARLISRVDRLERELRSLR